MSDFLLDETIDVATERISHGAERDDSFLRNEGADDGMDPAILDLLRQWNIGGDERVNPFDDEAFLQDLDAEALDLMSSWDDNDGWNPPEPDPLGHPLQEAFFHNTDGIENGDPLFIFSSSASGNARTAETTSDEANPSEIDYSSYYYCQPCNDPLATVPWFLNEEESAEIDSYDGQLKDLLALQQEEDAFWKQQHVYNNDDFEPIPLFPPPTSLHGPEEGEVERDVKPPQSERVDAAIFEQAIPYVASFADSVFPMGDESAPSLERMRDAYQTRIQDALDQGASQSPRTKFPCPPRECYGHTERILGCALSHDGRYLATASQDATVRVWTVRTHRLLHTLPGHNKDYECLRVAWTHSSQWGSGQDTDCYFLATGGADGNVFVWGCVDPEVPSVWTLYAQLDHSLWHAQRKTPTNTAEAALGTIAEEDGADDPGQQSEIVETDETPQIYSLQFISQWAALSANSLDGDLRGSFLLTSSDDYVHVWEWVAASEEDDESSSKKRKGGDAASGDAVVVEEEDEEHSAMIFQEVLSLHFSCLDHAGYGVRVGSLTAPNNFGGARNPHNLVFVFDAAYCPTNGLLGVALSDGTLRLMNGRGVCRSVLQLPPSSVERVSTHLTSFAWDQTGQRLATTVATGHLVTWNLEIHNPLGVVVDPPGEPVNPLHRLVSEGIHTTCCAVMSGGHAFGKPLYGCTFLGADDALLISYGSDGRVCLWDSRRVGEVHAPLAILWDNPHPIPRRGNVGEGEGYPIYALVVSSPTKRLTTGKDEEAETGDSKSTTTVQLYQSTVVIAGGGTANGGLLGIPVYLQDVYFLDETTLAEEEPANPLSSSPTTEPAIS